MKTEITKVSKNLGTLVIKEVNYNVAKKMTIENHYSKKWNTSFGKINYGIFKNDILLGVAVFGNLMNPNSYKNITTLGKDSVIELNRMWISDELGKNAETILISSSFKCIKKDYPHIKFVQSFADGRLGCGTIYKASNFKYYGFEKSLFFEDIDTGEVFHKVPLENTKRPLGFINKNKRYLDNKLKAFIVKTYKYIYPLSKDKILLKECPYPEYDKGYEYIPYHHSLGLLCRLGLMLHFLEDKEYFEKVQKHIIELGYTTHEIRAEVLKQKNNTSYKWFISEYNIEKLKS
jgi:hypothetical protein